VRTYLNVFFRIKMVMLALAGVNAWIFHRAEPSPSAARAAGAVSLFLWASIVVAGRMIAYNWFDPPGVH